MTYLKLDNNTFPTNPPLGLFPTGISNEYAIRRRELDLQILLRDGLSSKGSSLILFAVQWLEHFSKLVLQAIVLSMHALVLKIR